MEKSQTKKTSQLKLTEEEVKQRDELSEYIRKEIFEYTEKEKTPQYFWKRIAGIKCGEFVPRTGMKEEPCYYSYGDILIVFKMCKYDISNMINNMEFKDEHHKINCVLKIIQANMIPIMRTVEKNRKNTLKEPDISEIKKYQETTTDNYKSKSKDIDESLEEFL